MQIAVSNYWPEGKISQDDVPAWRAFNGSFRNIDVPADELAHLIQTGHAYTAQHRHYRHSKNFVAGQHLGLDFDTEDASSSPAALTMDGFITNYAAFIHTTPSHKPDTPRSRVVFELDRPIKDKDKYGELARSLVHKFGRTDKKCKDPARFYYGSQGCEIWWIGNTLSLDTCATKLVLPYRKHVERTKIVPGVALPPSQIPNKLLAAHSKSLLDRVRFAPDGEKHGTLYDIAHTFGGYVAGGYYDLFTVQGWLQEAIAANQNNVKSLRAAYKTIDDALETGVGRPLSYEQKPRDLSHVQPPLTPGQQKQVERIIESRVFKKVEEIAKAWGLPASAVKEFGIGWGEYVIEDTGEMVIARTLPLGDNTEHLSEERTWYDDNRQCPPLSIGNEEHSLVFTSTTSALLAHYNLGEVPGYTTVGLPQVPVNSNDLVGPLTIMMEPGDTLKERGLANVWNRTRTVKLPAPMEIMVNAGVNNDDLKRLAGNARRV